MKRIFFLTILASLMTLSPHNMRAQNHYEAPPIEKIRKPYKFSDNLFYGYSIGASYSLSSFVKEQNALSMLRPNIDLYIGKTFSKLFSAKASLGYHCQAASIGDNTLNTIYEYSGDKTMLDKGPNYSIHMANLSLTGMICFNRLFGNQNQNAKIRVYGLAGAGLNGCIAYSDNSKNWDGYINVNRSFKVAPELHAGMQIAFRVSDKTDFTIQGTWHQSTTDYTGISLDGSSRHYVELTFGITKRLLNRYASYFFEDCRGNETYYFDINETRMLKEYERTHAKSEVCPSKNETILSFPHTYPYLTGYQTAKVEKMLMTLRQHPTYEAVINIYPYVAANDEITFEESVEICRDEIQTVIKSLWGEDSEPRVRYVSHINEESPVNPDGIWFHNAFISYEEVR